MNLLVIFLIAISLSMDAFSLAISIGTLSLSTKSNLVLSAIVGLFHFFMPFLGSVCSFVILKNTHINIELLAGIIFLYIGVQMVREFKEKQKLEFNKDIFGYLLFALGVSLDSFGVGMTLSLDIKILISLVIFALCSFSFTLAGLILGKATHKLFGRYAILIGAIIMFGLAIINFVNFCSF